MSVAKLARLASIHRSTLFNYMEPGSGLSVTTNNVVAIALAAGDDPIIAFRAAAGMSGEAPEDEEISLVLQAEISDQSKDEIIASIMERRERNREIERQRGLDDTIRMIRIAGGKVA